MQRIMSALHAKIESSATVLWGVHSQLMQDSSSQARQLCGTLEQCKGLMARLTALPAQLMLAYPAYLTEVVRVLGELAKDLEGANTLAESSEAADEFCLGLDCILNIFMSFFDQASWTFHAISQPLPAGRLAN